MSRLALPDAAHARARAGAGMALAAIVCVQIGIAASVGLFDDVGPEGAAAMRLAWAGVILLALVRPRPSAFSRRALVGSAVLGVVTGALTLCFMAAGAPPAPGTAGGLRVPRPPRGGGAGRRRGGEGLAGGAAVRGLPRP